MAVILPVDRILDMCRTAVYVTRDTVCCSVIAYAQGEVLFTDRQ